MDQSLEYKIGVMQAFLAGQSIEACLLTDTLPANFFTTADPSWDWTSYHYRVRSKPVSWKDVVIEELITCGIYTNEHESNPEKAVKDLIACEIAMALDPLVSREARKLRDTALETVTESVLSERKRCKAACEFVAGNMQGMGRVAAKQCAAIIESGNAL